MPLPQVLPGRGARPESGPLTWAQWFSVLTILGAGTVFRVAHLTAKPFWFDECFTAELARLKWTEFMRVLWWREANMTAYYLLLRGWMHFGHSQFFIRALSVFFSAITIPVVYWLGTMLYERRIALVAAALFAANAFSVRYAQEARSYALFGLLAALSSGCLVAWLRAPQRRWRVAYVLLAVFAVYSHLYALLLLVVHWMAVRLIQAPPAYHHEFSAMRRAWKIIALAVAPLLIFVAKTGAGPIRWIHRPTLRDLGIFYEHISGSTSWLLPVLLATTCLAAALPYRKTLLHLGQKWETWRVQFLLLWFFFPILTTALLSLARPVFLSRYMIFCLPALVLLAAAGLARLRSAWLIAPVAGLFLLLEVQGVFWVYAHDFDDQRDGSAAATSFILDHHHPDDGIVFHIAEARVPYEFFRSERARADTTKAEFAAQLGPEILFPHTGAGLVFSDFKARLTPELLRTLIAGPPRVWVFLIYNGNGTPDSTTTLLTRTLPESFARVETWRFPKIEVQLYSKDNGK